MNSFLCRLLFFLQIESLTEALYTSSSVKDSLLSSKEWVTIRTDINLQQRLDAECLKAISTSTTYCGINVIWMYSFFHKNSRVIFIFITATKLRYVSAAMQARYFNRYGCGHDCTRMILFRQDSRPYRPANYLLQIFLILPHYNTFWGMFMPEFSSRDIVFKNLSSSV